MVGAWLDAVMRNLRWQDAVDVLLLTLLFSALYRMLRRTVALQVALGLLALVLGSWVANHFGLILTSYLLSGVSAVAAVLIIVLFQHEIRLGLGRVNPLRWLSHRHQPPTTRALVAEAAFAVARHRKGALIVIPRHDSITEHVTSGTVVDARLSVPILQAIFTSTSPLHDGAVVVSQDRVLRAGVVLPLATERYEGGPGTRHRAAVGMARSTDALIVCVSEEDSTVSLIHDEAIEVMPDAERLQAALQRLGLGRGRARHPAESAPRRALLPRLLPYLLIFAGVVAGWSLLALDRSHVVSRVVTLEVRGLGKTLSLSPLPPPDVTVELRGSTRELDLRSHDAVRAYVELGHAAVGNHLYRVLTEAPAGIEIASVSPSWVRLQVVPRGNGKAP